jgi:signal transduction histidine kinase
MNERNRIIVLISIMTGISLIITGFTIFSLYRTSFHEEEKRLVETVESQARFIEAMARFDAVNSISYNPGGALGATLTKISEAHNNYEQTGMTMEITLAERKGEWISFLIRHRHGGLEDFLTPVPFESDLAAPMRQALMGKSGTIVADDYRGEKVLAAFEPVAVLNLGIVAKVDLSEIRAPFIRAGLISGLFAVMVIGLGATLFVKVSNPMIETINDQNARLHKANKQLQLEIRERIFAEEALTNAHSELEVKVEKRTIALSEVNTQLRKEIRERETAEKDLRRSETMLNKVFDGILDPLLLINTHMAVMMMNRAAMDYFRVADLKDVLGKRCYQELMVEPDGCHDCSISSAISGGRYVSYERQGLMDSDRTEKIVAYPIMNESGDVASVIVRISDITEKKIFERQLIQREKMASLGAMVSSMAHEINNPNNFISFNIPILRDYIREMMPIIAEHAVDKPDFELCNQPYPDFEADITKLLSNIENGSKRISSFISNLREFSHDKSKISRIRVDLAYSIESVLSICQRKIKQSVARFAKQVPETLPSIFAQPYAIEQILINFLINACHAADKEDSWIQLDVTVSRGNPKRMHIAVSDNGHGMDDHTQSKIFDPFFTTKSPERGTGLGLFVSHTLAERMGGDIKIESEPGRGSKFVLTIPVDDQHQDEEMDKGSDRSMGSA